MLEAHIYMYIYVHIHITFMVKDGQARACTGTQYTIFLLTLSCRCCLLNSQCRRRLCGSCRRFGMLIRLDKCKLLEGWRTHTGPVTALFARFYPVDRKIYWGVGKLDLSSWFDGKNVNKYRNRAIYI